MRYACVRLTAQCTPARHREDTGTYDQPIPTTIYYLLHYYYY